jgi:hypothetical protein
MSSDSTPRNHPRTETMTPVAIYKSLYLCLVDWGRRAHGSSDMPEYNALLGLASLATMNLFSLLMFGELFFGKYALIPKQRIAGAGIWIAFAVLHYISLLPLAHKQRDGEHIDLPRTTMRSVLLYAALSLSAFFGLAIARS